MPYIRVDLDGKKKWPLIAQGLAVPRGNVAAGFTDLWELVFNEKSDLVSILQLECLFGADGNRAARILVSFGFLESQPDTGLFRVCGAKDYLRVGDAVVEGAKKGGEATAKGGKSLKNLKQNRPSPIPEAPQNTEASPKPRRAPTEALPNSLHQSPNTNHQTKEKTLVGKPSVSPTEQESEVFEYWRKVFKKTAGAKFTHERILAVRARLRDEYTVEQIMRAVDGCAVTPHNLGQNDKGERYDDLELICRKGTQVERFIANAEHPPNPGGAASLRRETSDEEFRRQTANLKRTADGLFVFDE